MQVCPPNCFGLVELKEILDKLLCLVIKQDFVHVNKYLPLFAAIDNSASGHIKVFIETKFREKLQVALYCIPVVSMVVWTIDETGNILLTLINIYRLAKYGLFVYPKNADQKPAPSPVI
jgi:hypothetical protein